MVFEKDRKVIQLGASVLSAYTACYLGRSILSAILPYMVKNDVYKKESLGAMGSSFYFTYAIGQLLNGIIGDKINPKWMVFWGLLLSSACILAFSMFVNVGAAILLWGTCGFLCSMLWGPISKIVAENTGIDTARHIMLGLTASSITGTMFAYIIATIASAMGYWEFAFYSSGCLLIITAVVFIIIIGKLEGCGKIKFKNVEYRNERFPFNTILAMGIVPVTICIMMNGIVRNAVSFWIPTYIAEKFNVSPSFASGISIILPIVNIIGAYVTYGFLKSVKDNEHIMSMILFTISTIMFIGIFILNGSSLLLTVAALMIATAAMSGACNMYFSIYILRFSTIGKTSSITGFLDFTAYLASAIGNVLIGQSVVQFGWNITIVSWACVTLVGSIFCIYTIKNYSFSNYYKKSIHRVNA